MSLWFKLVASIRPLAVFNLFSMSYRLTPGILILPWIPGSVLGSNGDQTKNNQLHSGLGVVLICSRGVLVVMLIGWTSHSDSVLTMYLGSWYLSCPRPPGDFETFDSLLPLVVSLVVSMNTATRLLVRRIRRGMQPPFKASLKHVRPQCADENGPIRAYNRFSNNILPASRRMPRIVCSSGRLAAGEYLST